MRRSKKKVDETPKIPIRCFVLTDCDKPNTLKYLRSCGLAVSKLWNTPEEAIDYLSIMDSEYRLVIIETGTGEFSTVASREKIMEVLEVATVSSKASVFYTDVAIRSSSRLSKRVNSKQIEWKKYRSTIESVASVFNNEEVYIEDYTECESMKHKEWLQEPMHKFVTCDVVNVNKYKFMTIADLRETNDKTA